MEKINLNNKKIISAKYGALDKYINVLNILNNIIKLDTKIIINNKTFKKDPYYGKVKKLIIILDTKEVYTIKENEKLYIMSYNKNDSTFVKKSDVLCVTTFNSKLYKEYAYRFIKTYNLPFDLIVYSEDNIEHIKNDVNKNVNIKTLNINKVCPEIVNFINRNKERNVVDVEKGGFRLNAIRFCYKVFAVTHAGLNFNDYKYLIWLDADMVFKIPLTTDILEKYFIKKTNMMSYLGRTKTKRVKQYHSDCGFLIFNMKHKYIINYMIEMKRMYTSNDIYKEREWHDSYIWDLVRKRFEKKFKILNYDIGLKYSKGECKFNHVLTATPLFNYIDHLKGNIRKKLGTSDIKTFNNYLKEHKK